MLKMGPGSDSTSLSQSTRSCSSSMYTYRDSITLLMRLSLVCTKPMLESASAHDLLRDAGKAASDCSSLDMSGGAPSKAAQNVVAALAAKGRYAHSLLQVALTSCKGAHSRASCTTTSKHRSFIGWAVTNTHVRQDCPSKAAERPTGHCWAVQTSAEGV